MLEIYISKLKNNCWSRYATRPKLYARRGQACWAAAPCRLERPSISFRDVFSGGASEALRVLERLHVPRILAALLLILALFGTIVGVGTAISGPARTWAAKLPEGIPRLEERLSFMRAPINTLQLFLQQVEDIGETGPSPNGAISERGATFLLNLFTGPETLPAASSQRCCFSFSFSCLAIFFFTASSRYCRASGVSARSWKSRSK